MIARLLHRRCSSKYAGTISMAAEHVEVDRRYGSCDIIA